MLAQETLEEIELAITELRRENSLLNQKFEKLRKSLLEQHQRITPIQSELVDNRLEQGATEQRLLAIERDLGEIRELLQRIGHDKKKGIFEKIKDALFGKREDA